MQQDAVYISLGALEKYNIKKEIAAQIEKEDDRRHGTTWHVVVGKNFGSYVTRGAFMLLLPPSLVPRSCCREAACVPTSPHCSRVVFG